MISHARGPKKRRPAACRPFRALREEPAFLKLVALIGSPSALDSMSDGSHSDSAARPGEPKLWQPKTPDAKPSADERPKEYGGRDGLDPTRYGDWEKNGRCIDF